MSSPALSILFVPGFFEGPSVFTDIANTLQETGDFRTSCVSLVSTGQRAPNNLGMKEDVQIVRAYLELLVEHGHRVILVLHSAGGFLGTLAAKGLTEKERKADGKIGGVARMVFLAALLIPPVGPPTHAPYLDVQGTRYYCKDPKETLFNDMSAEAAELWLRRFHGQPTSNDFESPPSDAEFAQTPCNFLICENDQVLPGAQQHRWAESLGADIDTCDAGHMVMLSQPQKVVEVILKAARAVSDD